MPARLPCQQYSVLGRRREPLLNFILESLERCGCKILKSSPPDVAPFRIIFDTPEGERHGILCYAFTATFTPTKNRPEDEHSFQIKYGGKDGKLHTIWQDPGGLLTTLFLGVNPEQGFFVGIDPVLNSPTRFFIRFEFKQDHVDRILRRGWYWWERPLRRPLATGKIPEGYGDAHQIVVGGKPRSFLKYVMFERWARGLDQGHRALLAEKAAESISALKRAAQRLAQDTSTPEPLVLMPEERDLAREFELSEREVLQIISRNRRLLMAVRGGIAEEHLRRFLSSVDGVEDCHRDDTEGAPDILLRFEGSKPLTVECKNVLRDKNRDGLARIDFMRTRASPADPCSRYYEIGHFDVVAGCLHPVTTRWEFKFALPRELNPHERCPGRLSNKVVLDDRWKKDAARVLRAASRA